MLQKVTVGRWALSSYDEIAPPAIMAELREHAQTESRTLIVRGMAPTESSPEWSMCARLSQHQAETPAGTVVGPQQRMLIRSVWPARLSRELLVM